MNGTCGSGKMDKRLLSVLSVEVDGFLFRVF